MLQTEYLLDQNDDLLVLVMVRGEDGPIHLDAVEPRCFKDAMFALGLWSKNHDIADQDAAREVILEMGRGAGWPDLPAAVPQIWSVAWSNSMSGVDVLVEAVDGPAAIRRFLAAYAPCARSGNFQFFPASGKDAAWVRARVKIAPAVYQSIQAEVAPVLR